MIFIIWLIYIYIYISFKHSFILLHHNSQEGGSPRYMAPELAAQNPTRPPKINQSIND